MDALHHELRPPSSDHFPIDVVDILRAIRDGDEE